jgi:hypothetical protein
MAMSYQLQIKANKEIFFVSSSSICLTSESFVAVMVMEFWSSGVGGGHQPAPLLILVSVESRLSHNDALNLRKY